METFPNFHDRTGFPLFADCPLAAPDAAHPTTTQLAEPYFLLSTISANMTVSASPTFVCKDAAGQSFAVTLKVPVSLAKGNEANPIPGSGFDVTPFKKGHVLVVRNARRFKVTETRQGHVEAELGEGSGDVKVIPTSLETLLALTTKYHPLTSSTPPSTAEAEVGPRDDKTSCQACGTTKSEGDLLRCKGCGIVGYCGKECQIRGWNECGHKAECKALKAVTEYFG